MSSSGVSLIGFHSDIRHFRKDSWLRVMQDSLFWYHSSRISKILICTIHISLWFSGEACAVSAPSPKCLTKLRARLVACSLGYHCFELSNSCLTTDLCSKLWILYTDGDEVKMLKICFGFVATTAVDDCYTPLWQLFSSFSIYICPFSVRRQIWKTQQGNPRNQLLRHLVEN